MTPSPRLLVTASRTWTDETLMRDELWIAVQYFGASSQPILVHGDARGGDLMADRLWSGWGLPVEPHPADWTRYGRRAGFVRNAEMVELGADLCLAFIHNHSRGATMCADLAMQAGIPTTKIEVHDLGA